MRIKDFSYKSALHKATGGLITVLAFGYMSYTLVCNWGHLMSYKWKIDYNQTVCAFICYSLSLALAVIGWGLIMSRFTAVKDPRKHLKYYVYVNLLRRLPAPWLYLLGRVYLYEREGIAKSMIVTVSILEWSLIILSGSIVYILTLPFLPAPLVWYNLWFPIAVLIIGAPLLNPRTIRVIFYLSGQKELPGSFGYGNLLVCLVIYSLVWVGGGLTLYGIINSLYTLPLSCLPIVIRAWVLSGLITTSIFLISAGFGLKELTLGLLLGNIIPTPLAIIVALLMRVYLILFEIVWGIVAIAL